MENKVTLFCPINPEEWRAWLAQHHDQQKSVWLIYYKKKSNITAITWSQAVDEALCFGWIDSLSKPLDEERYMQFFSRRKTKSVWSRINKEKVQKLIEQGRMTQAGIDSIETAKQNGSWTILDSAEALEIPEDMQYELQKNPYAERFILNLSKSDKRNILQWLTMAKRPATRQKRIAEIVKLAQQLKKPQILSWTKKG